MKASLRQVGIAAVSVAALVSLAWQFSASDQPPNDREEVVFWHFWGGRDRQVVENVVRRFNDSQENYYVRAVAMPGNNLQAKLFLSVTGGDPPDLVNQDDPILADWSKRGVVQSFESIASADEIEMLKHWMYPAALKLSQVEGEVFAVCNGLDIRAMYYNKTLLEKHDLQPPDSIDELNQICETISPSQLTHGKYYAFLPDSRRLWSWGFAFGGDFYRHGRVKLATPQIKAALDWMKSFSKRYGPDNIAAFRQGDQSLPGRSFPLLPVGDENMVGRYGLIMDGQWRTRDIEEFAKRRERLGIETPEFGVCPLPPPDGGREHAGWVNGNFFVIPRGARNSAGAWQFVKFWIGLENPAAAAKTCAAGGWIPVAEEVVNHPDFQEFLIRDPLFGEFVSLAASPNQFPIPMVPAASFFKRTVESAAYQAMIYPESSTGRLLRATEEQIQQQLDRQQKFSSAAGNE